MKVLLDEGVPGDLMDLPPGHDVSTTKLQGWNSVQNGKLLALIGNANFTAFITNDKRIETQQQLLKCPFATLILSATNWPVIKPHVVKIAEALETCRPGTVTKIECGRFVPTKYKSQASPPEPSHHKSSKPKL